jgi:hypothetical protein
MKRPIKTYEEFIGDVETRNLRAAADSEEEKDGDVIVGDIDTDPTRNYDDEDDGSDTVSRNLL